MESVAVCRRQVDDNELSLRPDGLEKEKTASWGENLSKTDWNCTVVRAAGSSESWSVEYQRDRYEAGWAHL